MKTISEILKDYEGRYDSCEIFRAKFHKETTIKAFHTDNVEFIAEGKDIAEYLDSHAIGEWLMDKSDYERTILANCGERFEDFFYPKEKVLVILV